MRKGWFKIPGVQDGDRTLEEQMLGVTEALAEAAGKTVLDLGCAEGLIGREFALAGAKSVHGIDSVMGHLDEARRQCAGLPMTFQCTKLQEFAQGEMAGGMPQRYDIVLSLAVSHKLHHPGIGVRFAARSSTGLALIGFSSKPECAEGVLRSKHHPANTCNVFEIMRSEGFAHERTRPRSREETVQYWRRVC